MGLVYVCPVWTGGERDKDLGPPGQSTPSLQLILLITQVTGSTYEYLRGT